MKRAGGVKPLSGIAAQCPLQHVLELARNVATLGSKRRYVVDRLPSENLLGRLPTERRPAQQCEIGDRGEGIQVGSLVYAFPQQLFRRSELRCPAAGRRPTEARAAPQRERQPEIGDAQPAIGSISMFSGFKSR